MFDLCLAYLNIINFVVAEYLFVLVTHTYIVYWNYFATISIWTD